MTDKKIQRITITEEISYHEELIHHFWEQKQQVGNIDSLQIDFVDTIIYATEVICIMTSEELPSELLQAIQSASRKGVRVYLLCDRLYPSYRDTIIGRALIRSGNQISGTLILADPGMKGRENGIAGSALILTSIDPVKVFLPLSGDSMKEAYQYFIWNFWLETDYEYMTSDEFHNPRPILDPPFDVYPLLNAKSMVYDKESQVSFDDLVSKYIDDAYDEIVLLLGGMNDFPDWHPLLFEKMRFGVRVRLYIKMEKRSHPFVQSLAEHGAEIYGYDAVANDLILVDGRSGFLLNWPLYRESREQRLHGFRLGQGDVTRILSFLQDYQRINHWLYYDRKKLGDITNNILLGDSSGYSEKDAQPVNEFREINLGEWTAPTLRDLKDNRVRPEFKIDGYVKNAKYQWTVLPKVRSGNAKSDPIYTQWDSEIKSFSSYISDLKTLAYYSVEKQNSLSNLSINHLARFFLGKNQKVKQLITEMDELLDVVGHQAPDSVEKWRRHIETANKWAEEIKVTKDEIDQKVDENEQEMKWNERKTNLECQIADIEAMIETLEEEKSSLSEETTDSYSEKQSELKKVEEQKLTLLTELEEFEKKHGAAIEAFRQRNKTLQLFSMIDESIKELSNTRKNKMDRSYNNIINKLETYISEEFDDRQVLKTILDGTKIKEKKDLLTYLKIQLVKHPLFLYEKNVEKNMDEQYSTKQTTIAEIEKDIKKLTNEIDLVHQAVNSKLKKQDKKIDDINRDKRKLQEELMKLGPTFKYKPSTPKKNGDESLKSVLGEDRKKKGNDNVNKPVSSVKPYHSKAPNETLPKVGTLFQVSGQRELAIRSWDELELGEREAIRFNADLVVERNEKRERS